MTHFSNVEFSTDTHASQKCGHQWFHYNDVIMGAIASQITSLTIVYSIVYSDADQRKHQSSTSLAFVRGIHRGPVNSPHKWPVTRKMFPFDDVIMYYSDGSWEAYMCQMLQKVYPYRADSWILLCPEEAIWRHESGSTLAQVMACCLTAPRHCLNYCWFLISKVLSA